MFQESIVGSSVYFIFISVLNTYRFFNIRKKMVTKALINFFIKNCFKHCCQITLFKLIFFDTFRTILYYCGQVYMS